MVQSRAGTAGTVQVALRMSEELRDRLRLAADSAGRSVNSEIVARLEESLEFEARLPSDPGFAHTEEALKHLGIAERLLRSLGRDGEVLSFTFTRDDDSERLPEAPSDAGRTPMSEE